MEKKIEEMAIDLRKVSEKVQDRCDEIDCRECGLDPFGKIECKYLERAKMLLEKGYRKQVQGEWVKVFDCALHIEDTKTGKTEFYNRYVCSNCGKITNQKSVENCENYCSYCGAKMKGN